VVVIDNAPGVGPLSPPQAVKPNTHALNTMVAMTFRHFMNIVSWSVLTTTNGAELNNCGKVSPRRKCKSEM
jgi:hypothetical protein